MKFSKVAIGLDIWTDSVKNHSHLGATVHYLKINADTTQLQLLSRVLKLWPMDSRVPKDAANCNDAINELLSEFDLMVVKDEIIFITDRGGNLVNALEGYSRHNCINHFINNVAKAAIEGSNYTVSMKSSLSRLIKNLKCSARAANLSGHLVSFAQTRWNSLYMVLESFIDVFDEILDSIPANNSDMVNRFNRLNKVKMMKIKDFLKPLFTITKELETDEAVTATKILACYEFLNSHLDILETLIAEVKELKKGAMNYLVNNVHVFPDSYQLWAFFDPRFRNFNKFETIDANETLQSLRVRARIYFNADNEVVDENANLISVVPSESTLFSQFEDFGEQLNRNSIDNEIDLYLKMPFEKDETVLAFWSKNAKQLPKLFKFFCSFAAIPATSASVERMFSNCGNIVTAKRNRLSNKAIDQLAFLHKNLKK